jgi:hypothetical protein
VGFSYLFDAVGIARTEGRKVAVKSANL